MCQKDNLIYLLLIIYLLYIYFFKSMPMFLFSKMYRDETDGV